MKFSPFTLFSIGALFLLSCKESDHLIQLQEREGLVAAWGFGEVAGLERLAVGKGEFPLKEMNGNVQRVAEGPLSGYSAKMENGVYYSLPHKDTGELNIHGKNQGVTVMAWVKWEGNTGFVGGMWNEYTEGGKRQYGLFVDLPHYNGASQVCGHISYAGGPTPPFPYSCDYAASKQQLIKVPSYVLIIKRPTKKEIDPTHSVFCKLSPASTKRGLTKTKRLINSRIEPKR